MNMNTNYRVPIIVGVGEVKNASRKLDDAIEPLHLMLNAIYESARDASEGYANDLIKGIESVSVVASSTWPYKDLPQLISQSLGVKPSHMSYSALSGNSSIQLVDDTARLIARGDIEIGVAVGGEALASLKEFIKTNTYPPPWTSPKSVDKVYYANDIDMLEGMGKIHSIGVPMQVYALYENGLRAHRRQTISHNHRESASLYGRYARVAAGHPMAWNFGKEPETEKTIGTITARNRMICFPYPLLMNAFNDVNLAAACLLTSTEYAARMGIPREKWIFPVGGGRAKDSTDFWNRANFYSSPAIATALDMSLQLSGLHKDEIDIFDFYSCFPIVPKLACRHLGIPLERFPKPITLLGGLNSFGGAGANYSMHAVAEMVRRLRRIGHGRPANGLILANGGVLTHENAICLSTSPRRSNTIYPLEDKASASRRQEFAPPITVATGVEGEATIETYTVEYDRQNTPTLGHVVCRMKRDGVRVLANHGDLFTLNQLASRTVEPIGRSGVVRACATVPGQNLFIFQRETRL